ncbi:LysR family transcriptional regulator [Cysteiniphilum sp. QT6929]|uniref:LysR family transcriptional regulator n=1 Tax=Cysteiniphilum sp. QT6929 TaxID=2975055 RepID=UPI0024B369AD|nr:LysR family transcriptional regulator [Cysteiniphilum sp. QT6929]WHN65632.1 LysR family transcriptional regulator [Cysteiniphilum sp. QT6929]
MFTLKQMEVFDTFAKTLSITEAANKCYISVPGAWKHLDNLQKLCNTALYQKEGKYMHLTAEGKSLHAQIISLLEQKQNIADYIYELQQKKEVIKVAIPENLAEIFLGMISAFKSKYLGIEVSMTLIGRFDEMQKAIKEKQYDVIFTLYPFISQDDYSVTTLGSYKMLLCSSKVHFPRVNAIQDLSSLTSTRVFMPQYFYATTSYFIKYLELFISAPDIEYLDKVTTIKKFIDHGMGHGVIPSFCFSLCNDTLQILHNYNKPQSIYAYTLQGTRNNNVIKELLNYNLLAEASGEILDTLLSD